MALKDQYHSLSIVPLDGDGFNLVVNEWDKDENGDIVWKDEHGTVVAPDTPNAGPSFSVDTFGFTNFADLALYVSGLETP